MTIHGSGGAESGRPEQDRAALHADNVLLFSAVLRFPNSNFRSRGMGGKLVPDLSIVHNSAGTFMTKPTAGRPVGDSAYTVKGASPKDRDLSEGCVGTH